MIDKITRGWRPHGLLAYLLGPGRFNEHTDPRVIATWDGAPELHQVPVELDRDKKVVSVDPVALGELVGDVSDPAVAAGVDLRAPAARPGRKAPRGPVWHCSLRNDAKDRPLSPEEWAEVVEDLMHRTGIARRGDVGACRWVAIQHAKDHVHVAAVLVRQDNGRRVHPRFDYVRARETCNAAEQRLGLTPTAPADRTAARPLTRAEKEKAERPGAGEPSRVWLRRAARLAALQARDPEEFFSRLTDLGVRHRAREFPPGQLRGYMVAVPDDVDASGEPIWFGGRSLARDLSLPKLLERWASADPPEAPIPPAPGERSAVGRQERQGALEEAVRVAEAATAAVEKGDPAVVAAVGHAAGDLLTAVGAIVHAGDPGAAWEPAEVFDRATRQPGVGQPVASSPPPPRRLLGDAGEAAQQGRVAQPGVVLERGPRGRGPARAVVAPQRWAPVAAHLRRAAWRLMGVRTLTSREEPEYGELLVALAALVAELAAWHERHRHLAHQAAAEAAAVRLRAEPRQLQGVGSRRARRGAAVGAAPAATPVARPGTAGAVVPGTNEPTRRGSVRPPGPGPGR